MNTKLKWLGLFVLCIALLAVILPSFFQSRELPEQMQGVWQTAEADYTDRCLLLTRNAIGFGTGEGEIDWYGIIRVEKTSDKNNALYVIEFQKEEGAVFQRSLHYDSNRGGSIRFQNQPGIEWVLVKSKI